LIFSISGFSFSVQQLSIRQKIPAYPSVIFVPLCLCVEFLQKSSHKEHQGREDHKDKNKR